MYNMPIAAKKTIPNVRRPRLHMGSKGNDVKYLQSLLNTSLGFCIPMKNRIPEDGRFRQDTYDAVSLFQHRIGLRITGAVDSSVWKGLEEAINSTCFKANQNINTTIFWWSFHGGSNLSEPQMALVNIAIPYIGATEAKGNQMGKDSRLKEIFEADDLKIGGATDGYAWCSAFVSLCAQKLVSQYPQHFFAVTPPREPSVSNFLYSWAVHQNCLIFGPNSSVTQPLAGDIVVFTFSHIGIVEYVQPGVVHTIEGNTDANGSREGTEVARKMRSRGLIRKFIRLPVRRML